MLRCIRCGACMNHCPVYHAVGGHAYGWVYPGPDGRGADAVADRRRQGRASAQRLDLLRALRERVPGAHSAAETDAALARARVRAASDAGAVRYRVWASGRSSPSGPPLYRFATGIAMARIGGSADNARPVRIAAARRRLDEIPRSARRRKGATFQARWRRDRRSACDERRARRIFANIRRSLGVTGDGSARAVARSRRACRARRPASIPARGQGDARDASRCSSRRRKRAQASVAEVATCRADVPARGRPFPARSQSARDDCAWATIARLAAMPWAQTALEVSQRPFRRRRSQRRQPRLRRRRRDRHAGHGVGPGQSDHAQFSARQPHRRACPRADVVGDYETIWPSACATTSARARCRAR